MEVKMGKSINPQNLSDSKRTENELLRAYASSLISTTSNIDKFTTWLLAGIGAVSSVLVANINSISEIVPKNSIRLSLFVLVLSFAFGLCQKILAFLLLVDYDQETKLRELLKDLNDRGHYEIINKEKGLTTKVINRFRELHPWIIRKIVSRENGNIDKPIRKRIHRYYWQYFWVFLSLLAFLAFILIVAFSIKNT
jgi:hypothetical protein